MICKTIAIIIILLCPSLLYADSNYLRGTRTGWGLTEQVFLEGYYKQQNLFIITGTAPTGKTLHAISKWKSKTTFKQDLNEGVDTFTEQFAKSGTSIPENFSLMGTNARNLFGDPVKEVSNFSVLTPAILIYRTALNSVKTLWYGLSVVGEPLLRIGMGTVVLAGAPLIKPVGYTATAAAYIGTAAYGYSSSVAGGAVMASATATVLALDIVTTPAVALYEVCKTDDPSAEEEDQEENDDSPDDEKAPVP